ncbi:hypothetical protein FKP32DRAFT_1652961 [Trametes sanguinea]|nr:hypothetical protein FKP32DRAFT_1652961 [Trametes sanguinea]
MSHGDSELMDLSYDEWIAAFLPADDGFSDHDIGYGGAFEQMGAEKDDCNFLDSFVRAVNKANMLGEFVLALTYAWDEHSARDSQARWLGVAMYPKGCPTLAAQRIDWTAVEVFACRTPYAERCGDLQEHGVACASAAFEYQQRTHYFGAVLLGGYARLGRWDRSGVVFSSMFDYKKEPAKLARFFCRVAHATAKARGHDSTATRVLPKSADYKKLKAWKKKTLADDDWVAKRFVKSLADDRPWWRLRVTDGKHGVKEFLVGQPTFARRAGSPFVYLKDCWRVEHERSELEGDILSYLNEKGVKNIPTALYHGDVEDHHTLSQNYCTCAKPGCVAEVLPGNAAEVAGEAGAEESADEEWEETKDDSEDGSAGGSVDESVDGSSDGSVAEIPEDTGDELSEGTMDETFGGAQPQSLQEEGQEERGEDTDTDPAGPDQNRDPPALRCHMKAHRHYRLVVKEVGLPLQEFPCGRVLVWVIRDAIIAHADAYNKAKIMHRDISVGNILMIPPKGKKKSTYQGLLADWELSKRLGDYKSETCHPDRMGTWQFMSVHIQDHPEAQVQIADELESFVHVMLYCAIRYLPHTCEDVGDFMYHYFDDSVRKAGTEYTCGMLKRKIVKEGRVTTCANARITFLRRPRANKAKPPTAAAQHPINLLLTHLLKHFKARYALARNNTSSSFHAWASAWLTKKTNDNLKPGSQPRETTNSQSELEEFYEDIKTHSRMIEMLGMASEEVASEWPGPEDRLSDQLKSKYDPNRPEKTPEKRAASGGEAKEVHSTKRRRGNATKA